MKDGKTQRLHIWDNAKGILIFLVVFGHFILPYRSLPETKIVFDVIYFFHMPAFVFISGFLTQLVSDNRKAILKLCVAYLLFNLPMMVFGVLYFDLTPSLLVPYYSYWYLLALIAWRLVTPILSKSIETLLISIVVSISIGFWSEIDNVLALSRIIGFFPFFLAGYMLSTSKVHEFLSQIRPLHVYIMGCLLVIILLFGAYLSTLGVMLSQLVFFPYETSACYVIRIFIFLISTVVLLSMLIILPQKPVFLLTKWGRNSLTIYVLHRYITLFFLLAFPHFYNSTILLSVSFLGSLITLFILGSDKLNYRINQMLTVISDSVTNLNEGKRTVRLAFLTFLLGHLFFVTSFTSLSTDSKSDVIHPVLADQQMEQINNAISIAFVGDLILLRDQVREAYCIQSGEYNFDPVFSYAKKYLLDADFAIGVLEGPLAGEEKGYSTSNYDDGIPLYLNFPDSFADSIKNAGINLVTLANNHLLDMGVDGAMRTIDVLTEKDMLYVGAYRNDFEKSNTKIIEVNGLRLAVLSYTFPSNYYSEDYFFEQNTSITSVIVDKSSRYFNDALAQVRNDFERARNERPDLIIVLPHMGTQFIHETDRFQETWNEIFINEGADIILGDHSHAVQPIEFRTVKKDDLIQHAVIVNCPGNFVNSYVDHNGDATSIVKIFIDPDSKSVLCAGVIPMWTQANYMGQHQALPIYDILFNSSLHNRVSLHEMNRVEEVQALVTRVMLGSELSLDQAQNIYYLFPEGYYRQPVTPINLETILLNNDVYEMFNKSHHVVFVGDSITDGTKNGGYGWHEPLTANFPFLLTDREAWGSATTQTLLDNSDKISSHLADLYVIAIGTNDIRYRDENICAMTPQQYIDNLDELVHEILKKRPDANFIFISPWPSMPNDPVTRVQMDQKESLFFEYTISLENYCLQNGHLFVDPSSKILSAIDQKVADYYLLDYIHPNASNGLMLYSEAVISPQ